MPAQDRPLKRPPEWSPARAVEGCDEAQRCRREKGAAPVEACGSSQVPMARDRSCEETTKYAKRTTGEVPAKTRSGPLRGTRTAPTWISAAPALPKAMKRDLTVKVHLAGGGPRRRGCDSENRRLASCKKNRRIFRRHIPPHLVQSGYLTATSPSDSAARIHAKAALTDEVPLAAPAWYRS